MQKTQITERIAMIDDAMSKGRVEIEKKVANLHLMEGQKRELLFWLGEMSKSESVTENVLEELVQTDNQ